MERIVGGISLHHENWNRSTKQIMDLPTSRIQLATKGQEVRQTRTTVVLRPVLENLRTESENLQAGMLCIIHFLLHSYFLTCVERLPRLLRFILFRITLFHFVRFRFFPSAILLLLFYPLPQYLYKVDWMGKRTYQRKRCSHVDCLPPEREGWWRCSVCSQR
jgi:hypothetical protein